VGCGTTVVAPRRWGRTLAGWRSPDQPPAYEKRFVHVLDRLGGFGNADRECRQADRSPTETLTDVRKDRTVDFVETTLIDTENAQPLTSSPLIDDTRSSYLGIIADTAQ